VDADADTDIFICNIRIRIRIHVVIVIIKCGYYLLSAYEIINVLDYYLNLYARLNNVVINICNLK